METILPFGGFYESIWSNEIDHEEEREVERLAEEYELPKRQVSDILYRNSKYHRAYEEIAHEYPKYFFIEDFEDIEFNFVEMTSPKYYNFETDRIFAQISTKDAYRIYRHVGKKRMRKAAKCMFTSRDGFSSHYSWDINDWGQLRNWDYNQLYCLLCEALNENEYGYEYELAILEDMNEVIYNAYMSCVDWNEVYLQIGKMVGVKELEEDSSEPIFPVKWESAKDYETQFNKLRGLK